MGTVKKTKFEMAVAMQVAEVRRQRGLSQDALATMLEVSRGFIGQVESPNSPSAYSLDQINRLAYELECSVYDLLPQQPIAEDFWDR
jgi:transcriptional regulator with XRE-family HTH domain